MYNLDRFIEAQNKCWEQVLLELKEEEKRTHWMWFVFPQIKGLSLSQMGQYYAIFDEDEARSYFNNEILKERMIELLKILLESKKEIHEIFDEPDDLKFISSMTLFYTATKDDIFLDILDHFNLELDDITLEMMGRESSFDDELDWML